MSGGLLTTILLGALLASSSGGGGGHPLRDFFAKRLGSEWGRAAADRLPTHATTRPIQKGGNFCDTSKRLGAPVPTKGLPRNAATEYAVATNEFRAGAGCSR